MYFIYFKCSRLHIIARQHYEDNFCVWGTNSLRDVHWEDDLFSTLCWLCQPHYLTKLLLLHWYGMSSNIWYLLHYQKLSGLQASATTDYILFINYLKTTFRTLLLLPNIIELFSISSNQVKHQTRHKTQYFSNPSVQTYISRPWGQEKKQF